MLLHERRFLASLIDVGIVLLLSLIVMLFIPHFPYASDIIFFIIYFFIGFIYMFLSLLISKDSTIGLYSISLKLMGKDWEKPTIKSIFLRSITHAVPALYLVNLLYMLLNKNTETLFDAITDSFMVKLGDTYKVEENNQEVTN